MLKAACVPGQAADLRVAVLLGETPDLLTVPPFTEDLTAAWRVVGWVYKTKLFSGRRTFWQEVQNLASEEFKPDLGVPYVVAYPDVLHLAGGRLPYFICKAALTLFEVTDGDPE
jgi:hypothetical protein